jgi:hypothetical protein
VIALSVFVLLLAPLVIHTQTLGEGEQSDPPNTGAGDNSTSATGPGAEENAPPVNTGVVDDRNWGGAEELSKHQDFIAYVTNEWPDNVLNNKLTEENIRLYNIETVIGHDMDALHVATLATKKAILAGSYNPTVAQLKLHNALFELYTVPSTVSELDEVLTRIVNGSHSDYYVNEITKSIDTLADLGIVHKDVDSKDSDFWAQQAAESLCEEIAGCSVEDLRNAVSGAPGIVASGQQGLVTSTTGSTSNFGLHLATFTMWVTPCEAPSNVCRAFGYNYGTGILTSEIYTNWHIAADPVPVQLTNYGFNGNNNVVAIGQVIEVLEGDPSRVDDDDGYVNSWVDLDNPNARAASIPTFELESFASP